LSCTFWSALNASLLRLFSKKIYSSFTNHCQPKLSRECRLHRCTVFPFRAISHSFGVTCSLLLTRLFQTCYLLSTCDRHGDEDQPSSVFRKPIVYARTTRLLHLACLCNYMQLYIILVRFRHLRTVLVRLPMMSLAIDWPAARKYLDINIQNNSSFSSPTLFTGSSITSVSFFYYRLTSPLLICLLTKSVRGLPLKVTLRSLKLRSIFFKNKPVTSQSRLIL
jgi:hypothetical protein